MNEELLHLHRRLSEAQYKELLKAFSDSPKTLLLLHFLAQSDGDNFKTAKAVNAIYADELKEVAYPVLVNRFYKLRQALRETLLEQLQQGEECFAPEEKELGFARLLVVKNEYGKAFPRLQALEKECREREIYELLPEVLLLLLRCVQSSDYANIKLQEEYENKLLEVIENQRLLQQLQYHYRRSFRVAVHLQEALQYMEQTHREQPQSARFAKIYWYTAFARGVFQPQPTEKAIETLDQQLQSLLALQESQPKVPVVYYELHHFEKTRFDLQLCQMAHAFAQGKWANSLKLLEERQTLRRQYSYLYPRISESEYRNAITIYIANQRFDEALHTCEELFEFYEQNSPDNQYHLAYLELTNIYIFAYPKRRLCKNVNEHLTELDKAISVFNTKETRLQHQLLLSAKALFLLTINDWQGCTTLLKKEEIASVIALYGVDVKPFLLFCELTGKQQPNADAFESLKQMLLGLTKTASSPTGVLYYNWLLGLL